MRLYRRSEWIEIETPCKVNLFLEVHKRRADRYHDLDTVMMAVSLTDTLRCRLRDDHRIILNLKLPTGAGLGLSQQSFDVPGDERNLVFQAFQSIKEHLGHEGGVDIELEKRIPSAAGLGGGSSDAAAAIVAAMAIWNQQWDPVLASKMAASLGSDINFFIEGQRGEGQRGDHWVARCTGRGELVHPLDCKHPLHMVLVHPPQGCSTAKVFEGMDGTAEKFSSERVSDALASGNMSQLKIGLFNRMEGSASKLTPWIAKTKALLDDVGLVANCMSGSGSSRFALCDSADTASNVSSRLQSRNEVLAYAVESWQTPSIASQMAALGFGIKRNLIA